MSEREPITAELRATLDVDRAFMRADGTVVPQTFCADRGDFERLCDAIDAVHAQLERENVELRERVAVLDNECENMHDGGSIADELREYAEAYEGSATHASLNLIADRIDAEHKRAMYEPMDRDLVEHGWIRLPLDADGVPIRVGDVIVTTEWHKEVVEGILPERVLVLRDGEWFTIRADWCRHHAPTVEDVLREFADEMNQNLGMYTGEVIDADEWRDADNKTVWKYCPNCGRKVVD